MVKRKIPLCKFCKTVHLVSHKRRYIGLCVECERRVRRAVCPDCGEDLGVPGFYDTDLGGFLIFARCRGCQIRFVTSDGKEWIGAAYDDGVLKDETAVDAYVEGYLAGQCVPPFPEGDPRYDKWVRWFERGEQDGQDEE